MRPERALVAERLAAMHCAALYGPERVAPAPLPELARVCAAMAERLGPALAALCGEEPAVRATAPVEMDAAAFGRGRPVLAANSLISAGPDSGAFLLSVEAEAISRLVDRAFGGPGALPVEQPEAFSVSAELVAARLEALLLAGMAQACNLPDARLGVLRRDGSLALLAPFEPDCRLACCTLEVVRGADQPWTVTLAVPLDLLGALVASGPHVSEDAPARRPGPSDSPFRDIPLPLSAVLVDMKLPLASFAALRPGQVLPVAVARSVPLFAGKTIVARGTVGEIDDRAALKLTQLP